MTSTFALAKTTNLGQGQEYTELKKNFNQFELKICEHIGLQLNNIQRFGFSVETQTKKFRKTPDTPTMSRDENFMFIL